MSEMLRLLSIFSPWLVCMTYFISRVSVAQVATIINATITFIQLTVSISLVMLLIHYMPKTNTALAWSSISRTLHSSVWPTILRTDSNSSKTSGAAVSITSHLATLTTILVALAGVILPLGLSDGPVVPANPRQIQGRYIPDTSPLGLSTTPDRTSFIHGRQCGSACPGSDNPNTTTIGSSTRDIFNSTPHGPFAMQFRRFYQGDAKTNCSVGYLGTGQIFMSRNDTSVAEGLIIDMSADHPGIGFWDQTLPDVTSGATWSQDVLWLEPVTQCVNNNVTVDYFLNDGPDGSIKAFNLTDQGGFVDLTREPPALNRDGQQIDLLQHAYKGAAYSNRFAMLFLNATREGSFVGASYPINSSTGAYLSGSDVGKTKAIPLSYLNISDAASAAISCEGFGGADTANLTNVHVDCGIFLGPPLRTDGGDSRVFSLGSKWKQDIIACSSATRASIQRVTFSTNSTSDVQNLQISRAPSGLSVLWATEKTETPIRQIDLFWGRVDDRYENDPSLWTLRAEAFYLPAGSTSIFGMLSSGMPAPAHAAIWGQIYSQLLFDEDFVKNFSGELDFGIKTKLQSLVMRNPTIGNAQIRNLLWTDMMANNVAGTQTNHALLVSNRLKSIRYDFKYAIPGLILLLIWIPSFFGAIFLLITRSLTFEHMRKVFNHTSVGRVVAGTSALRVQNQGESTFMGMPQPMPYQATSQVDLSADRGLLGHRKNKSDWANTTGRVKAVLELGTPNMGTREEDFKLIETPNRF